VQYSTEFSVKHWKEKKIKNKVESNQSKPKILLINCCVRNKQVFGLCTLD